MSGPFCVCGHLKAWHGDKKDNWWITTHPCEICDCLDYLRPLFFSRRTSAVTPEPAPEETLPEGEMTIDIRPHIRLKNEQEGFCQHGIRWNGICDGGYKDHHTGCP